MDIPANLADYISRLSIATRIATNAYGNPYGPKQAQRRPPSPELLKFLGDVADALHNIDKGPEQFYSHAGELNSAWAGHRDKLVHEEHDLAAWLLPLPTAPN